MVRTALRTSLLLGNPFVFLPPLSLSISVILLLVTVSARVGIVVPMWASFNVQRHLWPRILNNACARARVQGAMSNALVSSLYFPTFFIILDYRLEQDANLQRKLADKGDSKTIKCSRSAIRDNLSIQVE